jgi:hypothetical protein
VQPHLVKTVARCAPPLTFGEILWVSDGLSGRAVLSELQANDGLDG